MKFTNWIASYKIVIGLPLLAFISVGLFITAYDRVQAKKSDQAAAESYQPADKRVPAEPATPAAKPVQIPEGTSKVVFRVDNMSCSGCISTIKGSLAGYAGIQDIIVDITGGVAEVYYDSNRIKDVEQLASSITASGYPARVDKILTADQVKKEESFAASRANFYIASVNGWDIARADYNIELAFAQKRYQQIYGENVFSTDQGKTLLDSLKAQVVTRLINEGIQMQEVQRAAYRVDAKAVDQELAEFMTRKQLDLDSLKASLEKSGYPFDYFMKRFENRVMLGRYLDDKVFANASSEYDKQTLYQAWLNNARALSKVTIYDKKLRQITQNVSSGGGCCPTSSS
ncbi:MAG: cation transporter [Desulfobacterales bacterium]|nr:cation transporter [Desulfobacterales bacterium]